MALLLEFSSAVCSFCAVAASVPPWPEDGTVPAVILQILAFSRVSVSTVNFVVCPHLWSASQWHYITLHIISAFTLQSQCITTRWLVLIFKCRRQTAPQYLQELYVPVTASTSRRHLHSAARGDLQMLACRTSSYPVSLQNYGTLPPSLQDPTLTLTLFCNRLKTHFFRLGLRSSTHDLLGC